MFYDVHSHQEGSAQARIRSLHCTDAHTQQIHSIGIHPWYTDQEVDWLQFERSIKEPNCVAIGECGLDKLKGAPIQLQMELFIKQAELAEQYGLPLIIHCVKAFNELIEIKKAFQPTVPWIIHGFCKFNLSKELVMNGFYFSLGSNLVANERNFLEDQLGLIPLDHVFMETDDQEIYKISDIYKAFSKITGNSVLELEERIEQNVKTVFKKWKIG
jgi:TatD DNase family protein